MTYYQARGSILSGIPRKSNWTWDPVGQVQYFWHRFYSASGPDLNFDNPQVLKGGVSAMRFWLTWKRGRLRLDSILVSDLRRDGTK